LYIYRYTIKVINCKICVWLESISRALMEHYGTFNK